MFSINSYNIHIFKKHQEQTCSEFTGVLDKKTCKQKHVQDVNCLACNKDEQRYGTISYYSRITRKHRNVTYLKRCVTVTLFWKSLFTITGRHEFKKKREKIHNNTTTKYIDVQRSCMPHMAIDVLTMNFRHNGDFTFWLNFRWANSLSWSLV